MKDYALPLLLLAALLAAIWALVTLSRRESEVIHRYRSGFSLRNSFIELNAETVAVSNVLAGLGIDARTNLTLTDVGTAPNSGDGDLIPVAVRKAATNLAILRKAIKP